MSHDEIDADFMVVPRRPPASRKTVVWTAIITSIVSSAATVLVMTFVPLPWQTPSDVQVPEVLRMTPDAADTLLGSQELRLVVRERRPVEDGIDGTIAEQSPIAGSRLAPGSAVEVVVAQGVPKVDVPSVVGQPLASARATLQAAGLTVGAVSETGEGAPGAVTATSPAIGASVERGSVVALTIAPEGIEVPDVTGQHKRRARDAIEEAGFTVGEERYRFDAYKPGNIVLGQEPEAGGLAPPSSPINLTINEPD